MNIDSQKTLPASSIIDPKAMFQCQAFKDALHGQIKQVEETYAQERLEMQAQQNKILEGNELLRSQINQLDRTCKSCLDEMQQIHQA